MLFAFVVVLHAGVKGEAQNLTVAMKADPSTVREEKGLTCREGCLVKPAFGHKLRVDAADRDGSNPPRNEGQA